MNVFMFIAAGAAAGRFAGERRRALTAVFTRVALYALVPLFMFFSLWTGAVSMLSAGDVVIAAFMVTGSGALFALLWAKVRRVEFRRECLPIIFMNSAYLGIPVSTALWGAPGATYAIIYNAAVSVLGSTAGIWLVSEKKNLSGMLQLPLVYAVIGGLALHFLPVGKPAWAEKITAVVSALTLPAMLVFLGITLSALRPKKFIAPFFAALTRMGGGLLAGGVAVVILGLEGPAAGVCLLSSSMPPAVLSFLFSEYFRADAEFAAAAVSLGTAASFITVPLVASFLM